jgi:pimeloyl-ACP methyl ester carboxylesterase
MSDGVEIRVYGDPARLTLVYLPGLHGDWTLVGRFRRALRDDVRFVEVTYPRTLTWTLEDHAAAVEAALAEAGIARAWVLAESFSSQVLWQMAARKRFDIEGIILAGGFVRHPLCWGVRLSERIAGSISLGLLTQILFGYARLARVRFETSPEALAEIKEFIARRTELDRQAAKHRLRLVAECDPRRIVRELQTPVYALTGLFDPIVPWPRVRWWLKRNCPALREYKIIWAADHNVLGTGTKLAAECVRGWMSEKSE